MRELFFQSSVHFIKYSMGIISSVITWSESEGDEPWQDLIFCRRGCFNRPLCELGDRREHQWVA